jgi:copper chaperone CopZ
VNGQARQPVSQAVQLNPNATYTSVLGAITTAEKRYAVTGMSCQHSANSIIEEVSQVAEIRDVVVDVAAKAVTVRGTALDGEQVCAAIVEAGYGVAALEAPGQRTAQPRRRNRGIRHMIPEKASSKTARLKQGSAGSLPAPTPSCTRNARAINKLNQARAVATRYERCYVFLGTSPQRASSSGSMYDRPDRPS